jgi:hypothetical protein
MSDQPTTPPATEPDAAAKARAAAESVRDLFATLEPPTRVTLTDAFGGRHDVRTMLPARAQIVAIQELERLAYLPVGADLRAAAANTSGGVAGVVAVLVRAATRPDVLDALVRAFAVAHPRVVEAARRNAAEAGEPSPHDLGPADLFAIEELVEALAPFLLRLAGRLVGMLATLTAGKAAAPTAR